MAAQVAVLVEFGPFKNRLTLMITPVFGVATLKWRLFIRTFSQ